MIIGCVSLVINGGDIIGLQCSKGRGVILPGGKQEEGETFHETAARELYEEAGLKVISQKFIFAGFPHYKCYTYTFLTDVTNFKAGFKSKEGITTKTNWDELFKSEYGAYYRVLQEVWHDYVSRS